MAAETAPRLRNAKMKRCLEITKVKNNEGHNNCCGPLYTRYYCGLLFVGCSWTFRIVLLIGVFLFLGMGFLLLPRLCLRAGAGSCIKLQPPRMLDGTRQRDTFTHVASAID